MDGSVTVGAQDGKVLQSRLPFLVIAGQWRAVMNLAEVLKWTPEDHPEVELAGLAPEPAGVSLHLPLLSLDQLLIALASQMPIPPFLSLTPRHDNAVIYIW